MDIQEKGGARLGERILRKVSILSFPLISSLKPRGVIIRHFLDSGKEAPMSNYTRRHK
jgi:hypothetical protein